MENKEKERFLKELDRRTQLWEGKRDEAEGRLSGTGKAIATIDVQVAEETLKRIEERKKELIGETAHKHLSELPTKLFKQMPEKRIKKNVTVMKPAETEEEKE